MAETIRHRGRVENVGTECVTVRILQSSACSGCSAAKLCQSSETKEKLVEVRNAKPAAYKVGEEVVLIGSLSQGLKATLWAYVLPLVLVVAVVGIVYPLTGSDALSAGASLLVLVVYYFIMYAMRAKFEKHFRFEIDDSNDC